MFTALVPIIVTLVNALGGQDKTAQTIGKVIGALQAAGQAVANAIKAARQKGELTAEQEADFQKRLNDVFSADYAQPRPDQPPV